MSPDLFPSDGEDDELEVDSDGSEDTSSESEDTSSDEETDGDEEGGAASSENDSASGRSATAAVPDGKMNAYNDLIIFTFYLIRISCRFRTRGAPYAFNSLHPGLELAAR